MQPLDGHRQRVSARSKAKSAKSRPARDRHCAAGSPCDHDHAGIPHVRASMQRSVTFGKVEYISAWISAIPRMAMLSHTGAMARPKTSRDASTHLARHQMIYAACTPARFMDRSNGCIALSQTRDLCEGIRIWSCFKLGRLDASRPHALCRRDGFAPPSVQTRSRSVALGRTRTWPSFGTPTRATHWRLLYRPQLRWEGRSAQRVAPSERALGHDRSTCRQKTDRRQ
jgi:hypothetical protein